jgi:hypothetical protein
MTVTELDGRRAARINIRPAEDDAAEAAPAAHDVGASVRDAAPPAGVAATGQGSAVDAAGDR